MIKSSGIHEQERVQGFILGALIGDALGTPVNKRPHHVIRMYFKGVKGYIETSDWIEKPANLTTGQNSKDPRVLISRLPTSLKSCIHVWLQEYMNLSLSMAQLYEQFLGIMISEHHTLEDVPQMLDRLFIHHQEYTDRVRDALGMYPNDMIIRFNEAMNEEDAVLFAMAMVLKNHSSFDTLVFPTINMGGLTTVTGALVAGALGMFCGVKVLPRELIHELEHSQEIQELLGCPVYI
jgi:hypothetical protein